MLASFRRAYAKRRAERKDAAVEASAPVAEPAQPAPDAKAQPPAPPGQQTPHRRR
jgi:hypothetical protein